MNPDAAAPSQRKTTIGRFELRRELGKGAQATVWLAYDARLEREVAVKLMTDEIDAADPWLQEARSVSRLSHPNIVPVFEADRHGAQPYLVFEYVSGQTLAQRLRQHGAMPAHEAVAMMLGVLEALQVAHAAGVIHRDLKPSNILVDAGGRARVMDFGIAARVHQPDVSGTNVGTPCYMSPEAINGAAPTPAMDIFSAGLTLAEMLSGQRLIDERDPMKAMARTVNEDVRLPSQMSAAVDDPLRRLLQRAVERDPARRWPSAEAFRDALKAWLQPAAAPTTADAAGASSGSGTLEFLLRRMRHKTDFPALSDSIGRIRKVTSAEDGSLSALSNEILKDVALTNKLLRLVNTANFSSAGGGSISTVSRAVALVGVTTIRDLAMSLVLLEHMHDKAQAGQVLEEFLRALMAGTLASELGQNQRDGEEAFIGAMFQNLGRLLTEYYFAEEAREIRGLLAAAALSPEGLTEATAAVRVLGITFEDLGLGVAKSWGLPDKIKRCMKKADGEPPSRPCENAGDQLRWLAMAANQITDSLLRGDAPAKVAQQGARYARVLGLSQAKIEAATAAAQLQLSQLATAMNVHVGAASPARRLMGTPVNEARPVSTPAVASPSAPAADDTVVATIAMPRVAPSVTPAQAGEMLSKGIEAITNQLADAFKLNEVLRTVLETMHRALGARRVVFCLRDPKTHTITGRFGIGDDAVAVAARLKVPLNQPTDLFAAVCLKGADTLVSDATVPQFASRLPAWYRDGIHAPNFLLLPMMMKGAPFALIYADHAQAGGIALAERELGLVRTLRNQAVIAFRQQG